MNSSEREVPRYNRRQVLALGTAGLFATGFVLAEVSKLPSEKAALGSATTSNPTEIPTPSPTRVIFHDAEGAMSADIDQEIPSIHYSIVDEWKVLLPNEELGKYAQKYAVDGRTIELSLKQVIPGKSGDSDIPVTMDPMPRITLQNGIMTYASYTEPRPDEGIVNAQLLRGIPLGKTDLCIKVISGESSTEFTQSLPIEPVATFPEPGAKPIRNRVSSDGSVNQSRVTDVFFECVEPFNTLGVDLWRVIITENADKLPFNSDISIPIPGKNVITVSAGLFDEDPLTPRIENPGYIRLSQEATSLLLDPEKNENYNHSRPMLNEMQSFMNTFTLDNNTEDKLPEYLHFTDIRHYIPHENWKYPNFQPDESQQDARNFIYGFIPTMLNKYDQFKNEYGLLDQDQKKVVDRLAYQTMGFLIANNVSGMPIDGIPNLGDFVRKVMSSEISELDS